MDPTEALLDILDRHLMTDAEKIEAMQATLREIRELPETD